MAGWQHVITQKQLRAIGWAEEIREWLDECSPEHEEGILIMDNLNIHVKASLYRGTNQMKPGVWRIA